MQYNRDWTFTVIGDFPEEKVEEVFAKYCPWCFALEKYDGPIQPSWQTVINSTYGSYPSPKFEWHIVFFRRDSDQFHIQNAAGLGGGGKCTISWVPWENNEILGLRIWHEMLHAMGGSDLNSDMMIKNDRVEFVAWMKLRYPNALGDFETNYAAHEHDPFYQRYYYKMLTERLHPPYRALPIPDFSASPTSGRTPLHVVFNDKTDGYYERAEWKVYGPDGMKLQSGPMGLKPEFDLNAVGLYRVALVLFDGFDTVFKDVKDYIEVKEPKAPGLFERFLEWIKRLLSPLLRMSIPSGAKRTTGRLREPIG